MFNAFEKYLCKYKNICSLKVIQMKTITTLTSLRMFIIPELDLPY